MNHQNSPKERALHVPFAHSHLNVALSRMTYYKNVKIYCGADDIDQYEVLVENIAYTKII
jgi:putative lipoic acid-binding regulatory protein